MRVYKTPEIRNVAVVGHGASGKTSLVDALAFVAGTSKRHGSVKDGTALTDYTADEIERKYSINLALAVAEWMDTKVNLIDTPGYLDFTGDALAGVYAADSAVVVLSATAGVEVGTEKVWDYCEGRALPRLFFVSLMDKEHANFERVFNQIKAQLTPKVIPVEIPVGEGFEFHGIINLFSKKAHLYKKGTKAGEYDEVDVPDEYKDRFDKYSQELIESIAATDDTLLERYLGGEEIGRDEAIAAMKGGMAKGELFPLFCGAAELTYGTRALLNKLVELCPAPHERPPVDAQRWGTAERLTLKPDDTGPLAAQVFKTVSEPHVGDVTLFRIFSGRVKNGQDVWNAPREASEKLNHLCVGLGKERIEIPELHAGDIGVVAKLRDTHTNDTLSTKEMGLVLPKIPFPEPVITVAVEVKQRGEEDKLSTGLHKLHEEDPTFHHEYNSELAQTLIRGLGERHLEIVVGRLARKFGVHAQTAKPKVAYRETFRGKSEGQGKHKKQTGGRGQFGDVIIHMEPYTAAQAEADEIDFDDNVAVVSDITGGSIPKEFIKPAMDGCRLTVTTGVKFGYPMINVKVTVVDGSYHAVDSSQVAFEQAGRLAVLEATEKCGPVLLEPIMKVVVTVPNDYLGNVTADLNSRRGMIIDTDDRGVVKLVTAEVPLDKLFGYTTSLRGMSQGRASSTMEFLEYRQMPRGLMDEVLAEQSGGKKGG